MLYVNQQASINDEVLYWLEIPYPILLSLSSSGQYLDKLNKLMPEIFLPLRTPNHVIEENIRVKAAGVVWEYKYAAKISGHKRKQSNEKIHRVVVLSSDVILL